MNIKLRKQLKEDVKANLCNKFTNITFTDFVDYLHSLQEFYIFDYNKNELKGVYNKFKGAVYKITQKDYLFIITLNDKHLMNLYKSIIKEDY